MFLEIPFHRPFWNLLVLSRLKPYLLLTCLGLVFFSKLLLHPDGVFYSDHSDLLAEFLPAKTFLVRSWQEFGELPLWCPYSYGGMPSIGDVQIGAFYPLHWPLYFVPPDWLGPALSWLLVLHVILAGCFMHAYARTRRLSGVASLVAALGYMFGGKWLMHLLIAGHYVMAPLAWLPLVLLLLESGIRRGSWLRAAWAGAIFALIVVASHPQVTFYAGVFTAFWTLGLLFDKENASSDQKRILRNWFCCGLCTAATACVLSAVQLLPSAEVAREATRAGGMSGSDVAAVFWPALKALFGPGWDDGWEDRSGLCILWVAAAALVPLFRGGRIRYEAALSLGLVIFSIGGAALLQGLPGFDLFQIPTRMAIFLAIPVSLFAGRSLQLLAVLSKGNRPVLGVARRAFVRTVAIGMLLAALGGLSEFAGWRHHHSSENILDWLSRLPLRNLFYWIVMGFALPLVLWLVSRRCSLRMRARRSLAAFVLFAELWSLTWLDVEVRKPHEVYPVSRLVEALLSEQNAHPEDRCRILDRGLPGCPSTAPLGIALPLLNEPGLELVLGYNPLDVRRYKEFLQFIMDEDRPIVPHEGIFGFPILQPFPIRNKSLLDLLGACFALAPLDRSLSFAASGEPDQNPRWQLRLVEPKPGNVFTFLAGGMQPLPRYALYENRDAFPRAFTVSRALPLAERAAVLRQLKSTNLRQVVLLEGERENTVADRPFSKEDLEPAKILRYTPNAVDIEVERARFGYLVLTDIWFPGWIAAIDGKPTEVSRADFVFRAIGVPAGKHHVTFRFAPFSYRLGSWISGMALALLLGMTAVQKLRKATGFGG
jgi:hypothetical protein